MSEVKKPIVIYVLEDDLTNLFLLKRQLSKFDDFSVFLFTDSNSLYSAIQEQIPDVILLDLNLGVSNSSNDGFAVLRYLKHKGLLYIVPVVVVTADIRNESLVEAFELGAIDYIKKPYDEIELVARIRRVFKLFSQFNKKDGERLII